MLFYQGTDEPVADDMQRLEQQAQAVAAKDVTAKLKEKVLFVRSDSFLLLLKESFMFARPAIYRVKKKKFSACTFGIVIRIQRE